MSETSYIGPGDKPAPYETALLLVDIQNDYFPSGKSELEGSVDAALRAGELLALFRRLKLPVVHVQHVSNRPGATFFLPDTGGVRLQIRVYRRRGRVHDEGPRSLGAHGRGVRRANGVSRRAERHLREGAAHFGDRRFAELA